MRVVMSRGYENRAEGAVKDIAKRARVCNVCGRIVVTRETISNPNAATTWLPEPAYAPRVRPPRSKKKVEASE